MAKRLAVYKRGREGGSSRDLRKGSGLRTTVRGLSIRCGGVPERLQCHHAYLAFVVHNQAPIKIKSPSYAIYKPPLNKPNVKYLAVKKNQTVR